MSQHDHLYPQPAPEVEHMEVVRVRFRRGRGCCDQDPVRMVTAYYDMDGQKLAEIDVVEA